MHFISPARAFHSIRMHPIFVILLILESTNIVVSIRFQNQQLEAEKTPDAHNDNIKTSIFALGSFWRSEAAFGCLNGVLRTSVGYSGGSKINPEYRSIGDHAESVQVEYDPKVINFKQLLEVFWSIHDPTQVFGQGPDVGNQYRSIIFTNGTEDTRIASVSKEREQSRSKKYMVTTQIQPFTSFYPAEHEHQKFELKRNQFLLQLLGNLGEEELEKSTVAAKLNGYAADLCRPDVRKQIDSKIEHIVGKGWPVLREM